MSKNHFDKFVPNEGNPKSPLWLIGEAPGEQEEEQSRPFVGVAGDKLINVLERAGSSRVEVYLGNLFPYRPYHNKFELLSEEQVRPHVVNLYKLILEYRPNVIAALGGYPLYYLTGRHGIMKWRGSILPFLGDKTIKVISTIHPSAVSRDSTLYPTFDLDMRRIISDSKFKEFRLPKRELICAPGAIEREEVTQQMERADILSVDIETVKNSTTILCVGFADRPDHAMSLPYNIDNIPHIVRLLNSNSKKVLQNGEYDYIQLGLNGYGINDPSAITAQKPYWWDTLVAQHVLAPELPRGLGYLTSIYTREPYYKTVGRASIPDDVKEWTAKVDRQSLYEYNAKDCCVTLEIALQQMEEIAETPNAQGTFDFEMQLLIPLIHISNAGFLVDTERRDILLKVLLSRWKKKQFILNTICQQEVNVRSVKLKELLYGKLKLPNRRNKKGKITTDEDAIVSLIGHAKGKIEKYKTDAKKHEWNIKLQVLKLILEIRGIRQILSNYILPENKKHIPRISSDGRIHSTFKIGPETGRLAASKYVDGTGFNSQTLPRDPVEVPDEILEDIETPDLSDEDDESDDD